MLKIQNILQAATGRISRPWLMGVTLLFHAAFAVFLATALLLLANRPVLAQTITNFDLARDWTLNANPNGTWSYGWTPTLGGGFSLDAYANPNYLSGLQQRGSGIANDGNPGVDYNPTSGPVINIPPGGMAFHPGPDGQNSIIRWTAPSAGAYAVAVTFTGNDTGGTDVHVLHNNTLVFNGAVTFGTSASYNQHLTVASGDTIDFAVGYGSDGTFNSDTTGITATITPSSGQPIVTVLHSFSDGSVANDGFGSWACLVQGTDGNFYGTSPGGGTAGLGTVFKITPSGQETILHNFSDGSVANDGQAPNSILAQGDDGNFYGTTTAWGSSGTLGTVYKITPSGQETVLHAFGDGSVANDGTSPNSVIKGADGNFYGTTYAGGSANQGTIFKITPSGTETILHSFGDGTVANDGEVSNAGLVQGSDGNFYGTTAVGGSGGTGTVFKITPIGQVTILHSFGDGSVANDGLFPQASLVQGSDGNFYGTTNNGGAHGFGGTFFKITPAGNETVLHSFDDGSVTNDGVDPWNNIVQGTDGNFYGTTAYGGAYDTSFTGGTLYRITTSGNLTILHSFGDPSVVNDGTRPAGIMQAADGNFYGTTTTGGGGGYGTVYELQLVTSIPLAPTALTASSGNAQVSLTWTASSGATSYNVKQSTIGGGPYTTIASPTASTYTNTGLTNGTTYYYVVTAVNANGESGDSNEASATPFGESAPVITNVSPQSIHSGGPDYPVSVYGTGFTPGDIVQWLSADTNWLPVPVATTFVSSTLLLAIIPAADAATPIGGVVFTLNSGSVQSNGWWVPINGPLPVLTSLSPSSATVGGADFTLTVNGTNFQPDSQVQWRGSSLPTTYVSSTQLTATVSADNLTEIGSVDIRLMTPSVIPVYSNVLPFDVVSDNPIPFTTLLNFDANSDGQGSYAGLVQGPDGSLHGTTYAGGTGNSGSVFTMSLTGAVINSHSFTGPDGAHPAAGLILAPDGNYYGTTSLGGASDLGTVFRITPGGVLTTLYSFSGPDGAKPVASLTLGSDGTFYGTASEGGANGYGVIFNITLGGAFTLLHSFAWAEGATPKTELVQGADGSFYGTALAGGPNGWGCVFKMDQFGVVSAIASVQGPSAGLIQATDGNFYGTAFAATVFRMAPSGDLVANFVNRGIYSASTLILAADSALYGSTFDGGVTGDGTLVKVTNGGGIVTALHTFSGADGSGPSGKLIQGLDGNFYGTTSSGGANGAGTVFRLGSFVPNLSITGISPSAGGPGTVVTITGHNFAASPLTSVAFNGVSASFTVNSNTQITAIAPAGVTTGPVTVTNAAGTATGPIFTTDISPPTTTDSLSGTAGSGGWYTSSVQVTLSATDPDGAADVASTTYSVDAGAAQTYSGAFTITADGVHTVTFHSVDQAGNTETTQSVTIKIDKAAPVTTASTAGATVTLTATDATSGVLSTHYTLDGGAQQTYTVPFTVTGAGSHSIVYSSTDAASNSESAHTLTLIINPAPAISTFTPSAGSACGLPITLTVNGSNFVSGATVKWNGAALATTFLSATLLTAIVPGTKTASVGTFTVTVDNPAPEVSGSNSGTYTVTANPLPVLSSISPTTVTADTAAFTLTANGSGYTACSTVLWNGTALVTTFVSATKLTAAVPASMITATGTINVTVATPAPGGGTSVAKPFTITAPALTMLTLTPASLTGGAVSTGKVTLSAPALAGGQTVTLTTTNSTAAPVQVSVIVPGGATTATFPITTNPVTVNTTATITATLGAVSKPAALTINASVLMTLAVSPNSVFGGFGSTGTVTLTGPAPAGGMTINLTSSNTGAAGVGANVTVPSGASTMTFPITTSNVAAMTSVTITGTLGAVSKTAILTVKPIQPTMVTLSPASVFAGFPSTGTVTINSPAPTGGITLTLSSTNPGAASVGPSVTVLAGATTATFPITTANVTVATNVTLSAAFNGVTKTAILALKVISPTMVTLSATSVFGGVGSTGTITINSPAPAGGITITLGSSNSAVASDGPTVAIPVGATSATFPITTFPVSSNMAVTMSATLNGVAKSALLTVKAPTVATAVLTASSVHGGTGTSLTVTLTSAAPAAGTTVMLTSSNAAKASIQGSVVIPSGATSATVPISTVAVSMTTSVTFTATGGGVAKTAILTVMP